MDNHGVKLDLRKQEHIEAFFEDFGGVERAKEKYPALYNAVVKTQNKLLASNQYKKSTDDAKDEGFNMGAIRLEGISAVTNNQLKASPEKCLVCDSTATVKNAAMIMVTSEMIDETKRVMVASDSTYIQYTDLLSTLKSKVSEIGEFDDHKIKASTKYYYVYPDGTCGSSSVQTSNYTLLNGQVSITEFVVNAPKIKSENVENKHINIVYDREPKNKEKTDYFYTGSDIHVDENLVKTVIPVSGYFKLAPILEPKGISSVIGLQLIHKEKTVVEYKYNSLSELNNCLKIEKDDTAKCYKVSFDFNKDWRAYLERSRYYDGTYINDCQLRWSFRYDCYFLDATGKRVLDDDGDEIIIELGLCINSEAVPPSGGEYNRSENNKVVIPYIYIQWGCFHKDTLIQMADGRVKKISEIKIGDLVMTSEKGSVKVNEIYKGKEEKLIRIETETGRVLELTATHPVLTDNGMVKASNLAVTAVIHTEDEPEKIEEISTVDYNDDVYNIDCNGALLIANGIISGDYICQNKAESKKTSVELSRETLGIMEDLKRMSEDFKRNRA